jgi:hypothetical protein
MKKYIEITDNYTYFLSQKTGLSFESANFYSDTINCYYENVVSIDKRPENLFCLDMKLFENNLFLESRRWLENDIKFITQLNALYYYAAYLRTCGNITEEEKLEFQEQMKEIYTKVYSKCEDFGPELLSFKKFPLWEIKS